MRRQVTRSGRTQHYAAVSTPDTTHVPMEDNNDNGPQSTLQHLNEIMSENNKEMLWKSVKPQELKNLVAPYGLHLDALERVIVTQHHRAVEVADPKKLVKFIENLTGGGGAREELDALSAEVAAAEEEESRLDNIYEDLITRSEDLTPALQKWKRFGISKLDYLDRVAVVTKQKARALERQAVDSLTEQEAARESLAKTETAQEAARIHADSLLAKKEEAESALAAARTELKRLIQKKQSALEEVEKAKVRECNAAATNKRAVAACIPNTKAKLSKHDDQASNLEEQVAVQCKIVDDLEKDVVSLRVKAGEEASNSAAEVQLIRQAWKESQVRSKAAARAAQAALAAHEESVSAEANLTAAVKKEENAFAKATKSFENALQKVSALNDQVAHKKQEIVDAEKKATTAATELQGHRASISKMEHTIAKLRNHLSQEGVDVHDISRSGGNGAQSIDAAIAALAKQAHQAGESPLAGAFYGRLHSVLRVPYPDMVPAVNAVLLERCNPNSSVVTSTRIAAEAVVDHFRKNKVGIVTCDVLNELKKPPLSTVVEEDASDGAEEGLSAGQNRSTRKNNRRNSVPDQHNNDTVSCLSVFVESKKGVLGSDALVEEYFGGWYLVPDVATAHKMIQHDRTTGKGKERKWGPHLKNYVTMSGALFKHDGEIVGERTQQVLRFKGPYLLKGNFVDPGAKIGGRMKENEGITAIKVKYAEAQLILRALGNDLSKHIKTSTELYSHAAVKKSEIMDLKRQYETALRVMAREEKVRIIILYIVLIIFN